MVQTFEPVIVGNFMSEKRRILVCLLSVLLASGVIAISDGWQPGAKLLHIYYPGVLTVFLFSYSLVMYAIARSRLIESYWLIAVTTILAYPVAFFAYIIYFAAFENELFVNIFRRIDIVLGVLLMSFFFVPTISLAWLFGALVGIIFLALNRVLRSII
jgi:hypothetical protein